MTERSAWPSVRLGEVLTSVSREEVVDAAKEYRLLGVRLDGRGPFLRELVTGANTAAKRLFRVAKGDFIYSRLFAWRGAFGVISQELDGSYVSGEFPTFEPVPDRVDVEFLRHWFRLPATLERVTVDCSGSTPLTRNRFKEHFFLALEIPLPPLAEQQRIVARIESLAAPIDEARALRPQAAEGAEAFVHANRNRCFQELMLRCLPARLDTVAACRLGKMLDPRFKTGVGSTPYLRNANVQWDRLDLSDVYQMDFKEAERTEFAVKSGDILVCEGGDIGKAAVWNNEIPGCCYQKALHRIRCDPEVALPRFILHHLFWAANEGHWRELKTQTTIAHLTGVKLKAYPVFVPPLPEQRRIVAELDALQAQADVLKRLQAEIAAELDALLPSILNRAFNGEL